jgi:hypothetical protein
LHFELGELLHFFVLLRFELTQSFLDFDRIGRLRFMSRWLFFRIAGLWFVDFELLDFTVSIGYLFGLNLIVLLLFLLELFAEVV